MNTTIRSAMLAVLSMSGVTLAAPSLWVETTGTMILSNRMEGAKKEIELSGAKNECVSIQLALRSSQEAVKPWAFEWTSLKRTGGIEIAKSNVELFRAWDIDVNHGSKENRSKDPIRARPLGLFPDALIPLYTADGVNIANAIQPAKDCTASFWVDITIPAGIQPGLYSGSITLKTDDAPLVIPVKLTVANVEIPAETTIPSMYNLREGGKHVAKYFDTYVKIVMAHRIQPTNYHYRELKPEFADRYNPGGKGFVSVMFGSNADPAKSADNLKAVTAHLKEKGIFDRAFVQLKDEPKAEDIAPALAVGKFILQTCPEWKGKIAQTLSRDEGSDLFQLVDHHVYPLAPYVPAWGANAPTYGKNKYGRADWDKIRSQDGKQLWFYMSNNQGTPFPTFDINTPEVAFEPRIVMWMWWYEKAYGHLFWDLVGATGFKLNGKFPPGDGQLLYEGDLATPMSPTWAVSKDVKAPVISRRMKLMRNGIGEWEMLKMAQKKFGYEKVAAIVAKVYDHMGSRGDPGQSLMWSYKESDWDQARAELLKLLE